MSSGRVIHFLSVLIFSFTTTGCGSPYRLPDSVSNASVISGDVLREGESQDWKVILYFRGDEIELPAGSPVPNRLEVLEEYSGLPMKIMPGNKTLEIHRYRKLTNSRVVDWDILPALSVHLEENKSYRVTGEMISGSIFRYWIEEEETGELITDIVYDPPALKEVFDQINVTERSAGSQLLFITDEEQIFASKSQLNPGRDCFNLIAEVIVDPGQVLLGAMLIPFGGNYYSGEPGYRVYEEICLTVEYGHSYAIKYQYKEATFPCFEGDPLGWEEGDRCPRDHRWYELWDMTDKRLLMEFQTDDLEVILDRIE